MGVCAVVGTIWIWRRTTSQTGELTVSWACTRCHPIATTLNIVVVRNPNHVVWHVGFPILMILVFSFFVYAMAIADLGGRLEITSTCLLGMMTFQGTVKGMLPPLPYIT